MTKKKLYVQASCWLMNKVFRVVLMLLLFLEFCRSCWCFAVGAWQCMCVSVRPFISRYCFNVLFVMLALVFVWFAVLLQYPSSRMHWEVRKKSVDKVKMYKIVCWGQIHGWSDHTFWFSCKTCISWDWNFYLNLK